jgi:hypothetical protein
MNKPVTRLDDGQYLRVSQIHYTLTHWADHCEPCSHDAIHRDRRGERLTPRLVWENGRGQAVLTPPSSQVCDDTVHDKHSAFAIALVRSQDSGKATAGIKGRGVVTWMDGTPATDPCWLIAYRGDAPDSAGPSTLDHVREMLTHGVSQKPRPCQAVLRDTWDATKDLMVCIEALPPVDDCPRKGNRQGDDTGGARAARRVDALDGRADALAHGKRIKLKGFPPDHNVPLFRVAVSTHRTDYVGSNDQAQASPAATPEACGGRWKSAQWHRAGKQVTGLEGCQCRTARIQRHHSGGALLEGGSLKELAAHTGRTVYQRQQGLWDDYLVQQLRNPSLRMVLA